MKYGLIGEHLGHSFSKEIHHLLGNKDYELNEIKKEDLSSFIMKKDFLGLNVTIPYKEKVIPLLDYVDPLAKEIGAVNTICNRNGVLYGYNTDAIGLKLLIEKNNIPVKNNNVYIFGTGGTSKTAHVVASNLGAKSIFHCSRHPNNDVCSYDDLYKKEDINIIINTTPIGMYPDNDSTLVDLTKLNHLKGVVDVIYNPLKTRLTYESEQLGIPSCNGLYMLVAQAVAADSFFFDKEINLNEVDRIFNILRKQKENLVLIGMPASGKSTIGCLLAKKLNKEFVDCDIYLTKKYKMSISDIFAKYGEDTFRKYEYEVIKELSKNNNLLIATGGGCILNKDNIFHLKQNGKVFFLDRNLEYLMPTSDRPTANSREAIQKRFTERYRLYTEYSDICIKNNGTIDQTVVEILEKYNETFNS